MRGDEDAAKAEREALNKRRLEFMQAALAECKPASTELKAAALQRGTNPLLRYDDPTRGINAETLGLLDGGVWRMGERGRPTALVTLEVYRAAKGGVLGYEFVSLTPARFEVTMPRGPKWTPIGTDLKMAPLARSPAPAESPRARLTQMRQLARRFAVIEELGENKIECRLLAQPIDRYADAEAEIQDGAMFAFANGTNPELGLLLESTGREWKYGVFRLTSAAVAAKLDDEQIYEAPKILKYVTTAPYMGVGVPVELPE